MPKPPWKKQTDNDTATTDDETDATVEEGQHGHNLVNLLVIVFLQRLVEEIDDTGADTEFCHAEETHDIHEHTGQTNEFGTKAIEEDFSGEERKEQREDIKQHAHLDIHHASMYPFAHCLLLIVGGMDEVGVLMVYFEDIENHLPYEFG